MDNRSGNFRTLNTMGSERGGMQRSSSGSPSGIRAVAWALIGATCISVCAVRPEPVTAATGDPGALRIYFVDVEGGQATLIVTPEHHALLVDAGFAGSGDGFRPGDPKLARDAQRILAAAKDANVQQIDTLWITHFHSDHDGGVSELSKLLPIKRFIDHGTPNPEAEASSPETREAFEVYRTVRGNAPHVTPKPGEHFKIDAADVVVVSSAYETLANALPQGGDDNPRCAAAATPAADPLENPRSTGLVLSFGKFRFLDVGDLSGEPLYRLACPKDLIGPVDVYLVAHHGESDIGDPATFAAFQPRIAVMNNGLKKGGARATYQTLHQISPPMQVWQLHRSESAGDANFPANFIANLDESTSYWIKIVAHPDGSFELTNPRTGAKQHYPRR